MKKCIICNTEKEEDKFNIEHVIPESAGVLLRLIMFVRNAIVY